MNSNFRIWRMKKKFNWNKKLLKPIYENNFFEQRRYNFVRFWKILARVAINVILRFVKLVPENQHRKEARHVSIINGLFACFPQTIGKSIDLYVNDVIHPQGMFSRPFGGNRVPHPYIYIYAEFKRAVSLNWIEKEFSDAPYKINIDNYINSLISFYLIIEEKNYSHNYFWTSCYFYLDQFILCLSHNFLPNFKIIFAPWFGINMREYTIVH